ncbi:MAG: hypothetical protein KAH33_03035 [Candidatus Delongbacteria bacterium]|nr:hypothetical protein [Candidatus Delongbacteria bacterium]
MNNGLNSNGYDLIDEFNIYNLLRNIWKSKFQVVVITMLFTISSIIYSLAVDHIYKVTAVIKPAEASEETSLEKNTQFMSFAMGGYVNTPVLNQILLTLKSDTFLEMFYDKYKNEERLFGDAFSDIDKNNSNKKYTSELKHYVALKILHQVIEYSVNSDHNILNLSIKLKDKYFAYQLMNELLFNLRDYIRKQNIENLQSDINFYQKLINDTKDPRVIQMLEKKLSDKIEKKFVLSSNVFTLVNKPYIPAKRAYPKKSFMVIVATFIGGVISVLFVSMKPGFKKIFEAIKG